MIHSLDVTPSSPLVAVKGAVCCARVQGRAGERALPKHSWVCWEWTLSHLCEAQWVGVGWSGHLVLGPFSFGAHEMGGKVLPGSELLTHHSQFECWFLFPA